MRDSLLYVAGVGVVMWWAITDAEGEVDQVMREGAWVAALLWPLVGLVAWFVAFFAVAVWALHRLRRAAPPQEASDPEAPHGE